jgi:PAS domain S-box-containing protein
VRLRTNELRLSNETLKSEISERLQAEQELLSTRTFLDVIIDNVPAMLLLKDAKTRKVVYLNRAGEELTGIDRGEIVGKSVYEVMPSLNANLIDLQDTQLIESGKPCESYEITLVTRHRDVRLVRTKKLVVPDEKGEPKYLLGFCEDVTEQRQTEEQLRHAHKMEALGQLTGGLAHDFNNLLAIIIGNLDVLSDSLAADTEQRELVQSAIGAAISGSELTRRLLAFARRQPLLPEQVDLNALLDDLSRLPPGAATVPLTVGARIIHKERIHTTPTGTVQLAFLDKSTLSIAPNTSIVINEFIYDPDSGNGHMLASLTQGALRFVGGALSHQGDASIATPAAAIGIRGGTVTIVFGPNGAEIINHFGIITIHNGAGTVTINRPDFKVLVLNWNTLPGPIERVLLSDIEHLPRFTSLPSENGGVPGLHTANIGECGILGLRSNNCPDVPWVPTDSGLNGTNQIITQGTQFGTRTTQAHRPPGR